MLLKKSLKDTLYYFIATFGSKLTVFLIIPIINSFFSIIEFGKYDLFLVTTNFILLLVTLGFDSGIAIYIVENKKDKPLLSYLYTHTLLISSSFIILVGCLGFFINNYFVFFNLTEFLILILFVFTTFISASVFNFIRWLEKAKEASIVNFFSSTLGILIGVLFIYFKEEKKIEDLFLGLFIGSLVGMIISLIMIKDFLSLRKNIEGKKKLNELIKISLPFVPVSLTNYFITYSDRIIILTLIGDIYFIGMYALFYRIAQLASVILGVVSKGFLPVMYNNYDSLEGREYNKKVFDYFNLLLIPAFIFVFYIKDFIIKILGNKNADSYLEFSYLLPAIVLSNLIFGGMSINGFGFLIKKKTSQIPIITFIGLVLNFLLSYILISYLGFSAVIITTLIVSIITAFLYTHFSEKLFSFNYNKLNIIIIYVLIFVLSLLVILKR